MSSFRILKISTVSDVAILFSSEKSWDMSRGFLLVRFQVCCSVPCLVLQSDFAAVGTNYWFVWPEGNWPPD